MLREVADVYLWFSVLAVLGEEPLVADDVGVCSSEMAQRPAVPLPFLLLD
jgi:hypothetical protein